MSRVRALFTRGVPMPAAPPASARGALVRATVLPAQPLAVVPPAPPLEPAVARLAAAVTAMDAPGPRCATPSCPRPPTPRALHCQTCNKRGVQGPSAALVAAGWTCEKVARRIRWRDPTPGGRLYSTADALAVARRDAARDGAR